MTDDLPCGNCGHPFDDHGGISTGLSLGQDIWLVRKNWNGTCPSCDCKIAAQNPRNSSAFAPPAPMMICRVCQSPKKDHKQIFAGEDLVQSKWHHDKKTWRIYWDYQCPDGRIVSEFVMAPV